MITIPLVLTMGLSEPLLAFCAATETVANLANATLGLDILSLDVPHYLDSISEMATTPA